MQPSYSRRLFLQLAGAAGAALALPGVAGAQPSGAVPAAPATPATPFTPSHLKSGFEVSASLYAWDLHDEGVEKILDNLQQMAAVDSVYLIALMHYERRPLTSAEFPHNPVRKMFQAEDSRVYWLPDMKRYGCGAHRQPVAS